MCVPAAVCCLTTQDGCELDRSNRPWLKSSAGQAQVAGWGEGRTCWPVLEVHEPLLPPKGGWNY